MSADLGADAWHMDNNDCSSEVKDFKSLVITDTELRQRAGRLFLLGEWRLAAELIMESDAAWKDQNNA